MTARPTRRRAENALPLAYFVLALLLVIVALPSALRQMPPQQNQTAELSPDAPPDKDQQSVIAALNRASSGTAGEGTGQGAGKGIGAGDGGPAALSRAPEQAPRSCPRGFGNPPRQTFSLYAPSCAPSWTGDNNGATWKGVTAAEIRVAVPVTAGAEGPVTTDPSTTPSGSEDRTWSALQAWVNANYQLWGRQLRLY